MQISGLAVLAAVLPGLVAQDRPTSKEPAGAESAGPTRTVEWKDGELLVVRVPVASAERELMTAIAFPEEKIETAITGWAEGSITATARNGLLFLRLPRKGTGHVSVIGASGTHYLLSIQGVDNPANAPYDAYLRVRRSESKPAALSKLPDPGRGRPRPVGSIELVQAMRLGQKPEGATILRATREVAYRSSTFEIRLLYVYKSGSYIGRIYEIENLSDRALALDASRFHAREETLILSGLRENSVPPRGTTRLYTVFWKE